MFPELSNNAIIISSLLLIVVAIAFTFKAKCSIGIPALACAFFLGVVILNKSVYNLIDMYPHRIVVLIIVTSLFFGYAVENGTMKVLSTYIMYPFRNIGWMTPIALYLTALITAACGAGNVPATLFTASLGFEVQKEAKFNPLLVPIAACLGANGGAGVPWSSSYASRLGYMLNVYEAEEGAMLTNHVAVTGIVITFIIFMIWYVLLRGWKSGTAVQGKPQPFNKTQKKNLILIGIVVAFIVIPALVESIGHTAVTAFLKKRVDIQVLCVFGSLAAFLLKLGDEKTIIMKRIPWNIIFMIGGMVMLVTMATQAGAADIIATWLSTNVPNWLIPGLVTFITCVLSFFSGYGAIWPLMLPLVPVLAESGVNATACLTGILVCCNLGGLSPFSTGGAMMLGQCPDAEMREKLFTPQFICALVMAVLCAVVAVTPFSSLFGLL